MERLSMCRVCLEKDIRLHSIVETHLQEMYECLVMMPLETTDGRPVLACYICRARLKNCYELRKNCLQSEELFTQMLKCNESKPVRVQEILNKKRLTMHNVVNWSMGHELEMNTDDALVEVPTIDVKFEQIDPDDIDEDALDENSISDIIQSADSDGDPLINVKEEQSGDWTSDLTLMGFKKTVPWNQEDLTFRNDKDRKLIQDTLQDVNKVTAVDKTAAKTTNEVTFALNDDDKEKPTNVPRSELLQCACGACQQCYGSKCELERHSRLRSDVCKKDLSRQSSTSTHTYTSQKPHQCTVCKKSFSSKGYLNYHMRIQHTGEKPYSDICKRKFSSKSKLTTHMRKHTRDKSYQCDTCNKQFSFKGTLMRHMHRHASERSYECDTCNKQFSYRDVLISHMRTHTGDKPYNCDICNKKFSHRGNLVRHVRTHSGEKPFHCDICKKMISTKCNLIIHIRTHTGEKPFHCSICKKQFTDRNTLNYHMRTHTGEYRFQCDTCNKQFVERKFLNRHMLTHTTSRPKPYRCNICEKQFSRSDVCKRHMRVHTGEKPFYCSICKKQFRDKYKLSIHMRTHTGEKPYQCDVCQNFFSEKGNLGKHMRTHTHKKLRTK